MTAPSSPPPPPPKYKVMTPQFQKKSLQQKKLALDKNEPNIKKNTTFAVRIKTTK